MKKLYFLLVAGIFAFVSCNKETEKVEQVEPEAFVYTFGIGSAESSDAITRSLLGSDDNGLFLQWESTDKLNSWAYSTVTNNYSYNNESSVNTDDNPVTFQIVSYRALNAGDKVFCKYPYVANGGANPTSVSMTIASSQSQNGSSYNTSSMPMVSLPFEMPVSVSAQGNGKAGDVLFYNVGSLIEFDIFSPTGLYSSEKIESVQFTSSSAIAGNFNMDLTAISASDLSSLEISGYSVKSVTTNVAEGSLSVGSATDKNNAQKVYMVVAPGNYTGTVVVNTNEAQYTYTIASALSFVRAGVRQLGLNLEKQSARKMIGLPDDDYVILAHYASSGYKAMSGEVAGSTRLAQQDFTLWNGTDASVSVEDENLVWTSKKTGTTYTLTNKKSGQKLTYSGSGSASTASSGKAFNITEGAGANEGLYTVTDGSFTLRHNSTSSWFAFYNTTNSMTNYFYFVKAKVQIKLATPQNVLADVENDDDIVVVWDAVENAESYDVTLDGNTVNTSECFYQFTNVPVGTYVVTVVAKNSDTVTYASSDVATSNTVIVGAPTLSAPTIDSFEQKPTGFSAAWTAGDAYATSYSWELHENAVTGTKIGDGSANGTSIDVPFSQLDISAFTSGTEYFLIVVANADGYASSSAASASFTAATSFETEITSFEAISGNIDSYISYAAIKGDGTTTPAINNYKLRLYKPTGGKQTGSKLTVTAASGYKITDIEFRSDNGQNCKYSTDGGSLSSHKMGTSSPLILDNLNAQTVEFYNAGTDKIDINTIKVKYKKL